MRIIAGSAGGRRIKAPPGKATRPTTDRVREALFSRIESRLGGLQGVRVLDLFSGSGALGLEALSRDATEALLVERDRRCAALIKQNARTLGFSSAARVLAMAVAPALDLLAGEGAPFGLALADPPYDQDPAPTLERLGAGDILSPDALVCLEHGKKRPVPDAPAGLELVASKTYGDSVLSLYRSCI
jgi:16S rRNA (guanine966-N2)-methyltransferase